MTGPPPRFGNVHAHVFRSIAAACFSVLLIAPAAASEPLTLISSDFTTNTVSGTTASSVEWTTAATATMLNSGNLTSLNGYNFAVLSGSSNNSNISVNSNLNTSPTTTQRGFGVNFTVSASHPLGKLTVKAGHVNNVGVKQVYVSTLNYRIIKIADSSVVTSGSQSFDYAGTTVFFDRVFTLSGDLEAGASYRLEVGMNNLASGGAYAIYDGVTLEGYPEPGNNPVVAKRLNFAKYQKDTASTQSSTYIADLAVDGIVSNFHSWRVGNVTGPHSLEITYPRAVTLGSAHLYSGLITTSTSQVWGSFRFQYHNGAIWVDIPGSTVTGNTSPERNVLFTNPVTSSRFRLLGNETSNNRTVRELAMFPPNPNGGGVEQGYPIGTDVVLNLAHKRPTVGSSIYNTNYAISATDGFVDDNSRWLCDSGTSGQTLEIDLLVDHAIGSAHVHTGYYSGTSDVLANFTLESWVASGSTWQPIPGATITGNTDMARVVSFSSNVTTSKVRLVIPDASFGRVAELQLFPPRTGGYPLGQNIRYEAPPAAAWNDFSDDSHRIRVQPTPDRRLGLINGSAIFTDNNAGAGALNWQLLLNYRDGSYRIRNIETGLCLALADISTALNTPVVGETYSGMPHQNWFLEYVTPTKFRILNAYSGLALQSLGSNHAVGTPLVVTTPSVSMLQRWDTAKQTHYPKKGIAGTFQIIRDMIDPPPPYPTDSDITFHEDYYNRLGGSWSYSWGRQSSETMPYLDSDHTYNPMQWGNFSWTHGSSQGPPENLYSQLQSTPKPVHYLGFNEPDKSTQGNITPENAVQFWPRLQAFDTPLVAPVPASIFVSSTTSPAVSGTGWLTDFVEQANAFGYRRDYTAVHWYANPNANSLIERLQDIYEAYGRPVWLTEFSTVDWEQTGNWTDADNFNFLAEFLWRAESLSWLKRYSLFAYIEGSSPSGPDLTSAPRSNAIRADGSLTAFGQLYAGWDGVTSLVNNKSYHLHSKSAYRRVQNPVSTSPADLVATVSPETAVTGNQWFMISGTTPNTVRIVSTLDGRRLRYFNGTYVGMVAATNFTGQSEWQPVANEHGWYYLNHPQSNTRLRITGSNTLATGSITTGTTDDYKWRFVVPAVSDPIEPDAPVVSALGGAKQISLTWNPVPNATAYNVERFDATGQTWQSMLTGGTQTTWTNTGLPASTTYSYRVMATNVLGTSAPSATVSASTLHPLESLASWQAEYLASLPSNQQLPTADPNGNGVPNLMEYAFARHPVNPANSPFTTSTTGSSVVMVFPWNWRATDISWQVRSGTDLTTRASWPVVVPDQVQTVRNGDVDQLNLTFPLTNPTRQFFHLEVTGTAN